MHFELGYAIAKKGSDLGRVYIFSEEVDKKAENNKPCSDLAGYMLTKYTVSKKVAKSKSSKINQSTLKLKDERGFRAALISTLTEVARERGMWGGTSKTFETESDADS